jgi:transcription elongation factor Elf1
LARARRRLRNPVRAREGEMEARCLCLFCDDQTFARSEQGAIVDARGVAEANHGRCTGLG